MAAWKEILRRWAIGWASAGLVGVLFGCGSSDPAFGPPTPSVVKVSPAAPPQPPKPARNAPVRAAFDSRTADFSTSIRSGRMTVAALTVDETLLAIGGEDGGVTIWEAGPFLEVARPTGRTWYPRGDGVFGVGTTHPLQTLRGHAGFVRSLIFAPDGKTLYSADDGVAPGEVCIWDVPSGTLRKRVAGARRRTSLALSPDGSLLALGSSAPGEKSLRLLDARTGEAIRTLDLPGPCTGCAFLVSPRGGRETALVVGSGKEAVVWATPAGVRLRTFQFEGEVRSVAAAPDRKSFAVLHGDADDRDCLAFFAADGVAPTRVDPPLAGLSNRCRNLQYLPDGRGLVATTGHDDNPSSTPVFIDAASGEVVYCMISLSTAPFCLPRDGSILLGASGGLAAWSLADLFDRDLQERLRPMTHPLYVWRFYREGAALVVDVDVNDAKAVETVVQAAAAGPLVTLDLRGAELPLDQILPKLVGKRRIVGIFSDQNKWSEEEISLLSRFPELEELVLSTSVKNEWLDAAAALPKLRRLELGGLRDADLARLAKAAGALEQLELGLADDTSDAALEHLGKLTSLRSLILSGKKLSAAALARLKPLTKLRRLSVRLRPDAGPGADVFAGMPELVDLELIGVPSSGLEHAVGVKRLVLFEKIHPEAFDGVARMPSLVELRAGAFDSEFKGRGLAKLKDAPRLRRLDVSESGLDDAGAAEIGAISQLEALEVEDCESLTDAGFAKFAGLARVRFLNASETKIVGPGLSAFRGMPLLEVLELQETTLDGSGASHFASLAKLQSLDLSSTSVGDDVVPHLARLSELQRLNISRTKITPRGLAPLRTLPRLRFLDCDGLRGPEEAVWRKARPNLNEP